MLKLDILAPTSQGQPQFNSTFNESLSARGCDPNGKFAIIVHGWLEKWRTEWVQDLISNLTVYRGDCIIFMDYSNFSVTANYFYLVLQFEQISTILYRFMEQLDDEGFDFSKGYMFGFSFGAHLAINTALDFAKKYDGKKLKEIDGELQSKISSTFQEKLFNVSFPSRQFAIRVRWL